MGVIKISAQLGAAAALALAAGLGAAQFAQAQATDEAPHPGKAIYDQSCAACHDKPEAGSRAAPLANLKKMSAQALTASLTTGVMKPIGDQLDRRQLRAVVDYLAAPEGPVGTAWIDDARCTADKAVVNLDAKPAQIGFGVDQDNTRRMSAGQAGLKTQDLAKLEVAWTFAMPRTSGLRSQGVVVGDTLFYPAGQSNYLLALDVGTGCVKWATPIQAAIRNSLAYGRLGANGPWAVVGGDGAGNLIAFEAKTGKMVWKADPRHDKTVPLSGSPLFAGDSRIIVPISAMDVAAAMRPTFQCCKSHGAVAAVDAATGKTLWTWHTMEDAKPLGRKNSQGVEMFGPSGAPIWSSPAVDLKKGVVYVSTGENTSPPATKTSDAVIAVDLATGNEKWVFQALANDVWNMSCPLGPPPPGKPLSPNCFFANEGSVLKDHDFGGGPVIWRGRGREVILAGQKSGEVWALRPQDGKVLWRHQFGEGTALGGVHWAIAADATRVYAPISDPNVPPEKSAAGMYAIDVASGKVAWSWRATPDCSGDRKTRAPVCDGKYGLSAAPLVVDGAVVAGSLDGRVYVFDAASGKVLATYDVARPHKSVNGLSGNGGSIDAAGVFAGSGTLFVNAGYGSFGQIPGNVLVAMRPAK